MVKGCISCTREPNTCISAQLPTVFTIKVFRTISRSDHATCQLFCFLPFSMSNFQFPLLRVSVFRFACFLLPILDFFERMVAPFVLICFDFSMAQSVTSAFVICTLCKSTPCFSKPSTNCRKAYLTQRLDSLL